MKRKVLVILSGGLDSTVLAYYTAGRPDTELVGCVSVDYGQRHGKELSRAARTCGKLNVPHTVLDLHSVRDALGASSLTSDQDVPHGHYAEDSMKKTVVPNRNMILMALAVGVGITQGAEIVSYGAHAGDHAVYPDCRPEFANAMVAAIRLCDYRPIELTAPFIQATKADIVGIGREFGVPFEDTWTCYEGGQVSCGCCGTCVERLEAFHLAQVRDPLEYKDREFWKRSTSQAPLEIHEQTR